MPAAPWLSVVMPTYQGARYVAAALTSVVEACAGDSGVEVVVVDDGSTDETVRVVRGFEDRLALRLVAGERRGSWVAATNAGLQAARGEHATFLHQDDVWQPGRLPAVQAMLAAAPDATMVVHAARFLSPVGADLGPWRLPFGRGRGVLGGDEVAERLLVQNFLCIAAPVFRREDALAGGGLDERYWYTADWDLWLRLARRGGVVAYDSRPFVGFRVHPASQTAQGSSDPASFRAQLVEVFERHVDGAPPAVERAGRAAIELNVALGGASHGVRPAFGPLARALVALRPASVRRLVRDSRLHERLGARLRARRRA